MWLKKLGYIIFISILSLCNCQQNILRECLVSLPSSDVLKCFGRELMYSLQYLHKSENISFGPDLIMLKTNNENGRSLPDLFTEESADFRTLIENAGIVFSQRSLKWDLSKLYPGLILRIGPTENEPSVLEFIMDSSKIINDRHFIQNESTGRIFTRKLILPFLLGLKLSLVAIIPLIFAGIILLCKKAAFLGSFAIFITTLLSGKFFQNGFGSTWNNFGGINAGYDPRPVNEYNSGNYLLSNGYSKDHIYYDNIATAQPIEKFYNYDHSNYHTNPKYITGKSSIGFPDSF